MHSSLVRTYHAALYSILLLVAVSTGAAHAVNYCWPSTYRAQRPDVVAARISATRHYLLWGRNEGMCRPFYNCSREEYLAQRPDVAAARMDPMTHYLYFGRNEGMCSPDLADLIGAASYYAFPDSN